MRRFISTLLLTSLGAAPVFSGETAKTPTAVPQDQKVLHFVSRLLPWYPDSNFSISADTTSMTPSGAYRVVQITRKANSKVLGGMTNYLIDEPAQRIWIASAARLPEKTQKMSFDEVKTFVDNYLPDLLMHNMRMRARLIWDVPAQGPSALIPFDLMVESGFGEYKKHGAITADFTVVLLGAPFPYDQDPVSYRLELFKKSKSVMWDHPSSQAKLSIVEFSDFECPGCRAKWPLINSLLGKFGEKVEHGMVNYPIPSIHPWAFRAATAAWCLTRQNPGQLVDFKEHFYNLQQNMEVSMVKETASDFVAGQGLDSEAFDGCYLKEAAITSVHHQMEFGQSMGVMATPTYFLNGWMVQVPEARWLPALAKTLMAGEEPVVSLAH